MGAQQQQQCVQAVLVILAAAVLSSVAEEIRKNPSWTKNLTRFDAGGGEDYVVGELSISVGVVFANVIRLVPIKF